MGKGLAANLTFRRGSLSDSKEPQHGIDDSGDANRRADNCQRQPYAHTLTVIPRHPSATAPAPLRRPSLPHAPRAPKSKEYGKRDAHFERRDVPLMGKVPELQEVVWRGVGVRRRHGVDDAEVDQPEDDEQDDESAEGPANRVGKQRHSALIVRPPPPFRNPSGSA
jgi:hypothetical protein